MKLIGCWCVALILYCPQWVQAEMYKCKLANGSSAYQDQPCQKGSVDVVVNLPPVSSIAAQKSTRPGSVSQNTKRGIAESPNDKNMSEEEAKTQAYNKSVRCNNARQQLGILKEQRPVYRRDKKGERQYVEDENRPAEIAAAERRVAEECK